MNDRHTLRHVTHLFPVFLGLRLLPIGAWFLAVAVSGLGVFPSWSHLALLVAVATIWPIHRWYRGQYGSVQPDRLRFGRNWALLAGLAAAYLALSFDAGARPVVLVLVLILLAAGAILALPRSFSGDRRSAGLFLAVAGLGGVLLFIMSRDPARIGSLGGLFSLTLGLLLCLAGLIEHSSLVRALRQLGERNRV